MKNFYAVIIGTEILNGRRIDKHFEFLKQELSLYGHELFASFVVKDDKELMRNVYTLIKNDKNSVMFSFGGIGSTPDDLTREVASEVFTNSQIKPHEKFLQDILDKFGDEAYPHRIHMADLPVGAKLLHNPINNMSGFYLEDRFFFTPGFPSMAHPMIKNVLKEFFSQKTDKYRLTFLAKTSENTLISTMQKIPSHVELSSLPIFKDGKPTVELSLSGDDEKEVQKYFDMFIDELEKKQIKYTLL